MQRKFYININNFESDFKSYLEWFNDDKTISPVLTADKDFFISNNFKKQANEIIEKLLKNNINHKNITFAIVDKTNHYNKNEWDKIVDLDAFFKNRGIMFGFEDVNETFSINDVKNANIQITQKANEFNKLNLSPIEKILQAYLFVTTRKYIHEEENEHWAKSRSVYSVLNNNEIVCVGFSKWLKALVEEMGIKDVKVYENSVDVKSKNGEINGHRNLIMYIKDEKYGLNGYYYFDPTWDCGHQDKFIEYLTYFLVPLKDIQNINQPIMNKSVYSEIATKTKEKLPIIKNKKAKRSTKNNYKYNSLFLNDKSSDNIISFGNIDLEFTQEFLNDFINNKELSTSVIKNIYLEQLKNINANYENLYKEQQNIIKIKDALTKNNINIVDSDSYSALTNNIYLALQSGNIDELIENINSYVKKPEELIKTVIEDFSNQYDSMLNLDYAFSDEEKENMKLFIKNKNIVVEKVKDEMLNNFDKYSSYLNDYSYFSNFYSFVSQLQDCKSVKDIKKFDYSNALSHLREYEDEQTNLNVLNFINNKQDDLFKQQQNLFEYFNEKTKECEYYIENRYEFFEKFNDKELLNKYIKDAIYNSSKTISVDNVYLMLTNIFKIVYKNKDEQFIFKRVNEIIGYNAKQNKNHFLKNSKNIFSNIEEFYK